MRQNGGRRVAEAFLYVALLIVGYSSSLQAFQAGAQAGPVQSYDDAVKASEQAAKKNPHDPGPKIKNYDARFEAAQFHIRRGIQYLEQQHNEEALAEFQAALAADPSSMLARQELEYTQNLLSSRERPQNEPGQRDKSSAGPAASEDAAEPELLEAPPTLAPLSREPLSLKLSADAQTVFRTIGKLAGVNVIFDPDFQDKKITVDLTNVTIQQALSVACIEGKAFWKPVSSNIILVLPDTSGKRKEQEEQVIKKIYLQHTQTPQEITEIATGLQQMLELRHVQALPRDNAILVRDTPAKILLASRLVRDSDRGKAEVVVQISVLQVRRDKARSLGIQPSGRAVLAYNPAVPLGPLGTVPLDKLGHVSASDFTISMPSAVAAALLTDSNTKIIQNPEVRVSDGESARLRVGDRIPIATGSFSVSGNSGPLVNTQFQYVDVGVNIDLVPHVHPDHSVSVKLGVEVSSLNGQVNIGGVEQPVISQRRIDHEIRLQEGEVSILGGLVERSQSKSVTGWPGLSRLPLLRYLFSGEDVTNSENEVLIVIHPRLVRMRDLTVENLKALSVGTDQEMVLRQKQDVLTPPPSPAQMKPVAMDAGAAGMSLAAQPELQGLLKLEPQSATIKAGETTIAQLRLENVEDLFSASLILKYDPQVLAIEDVRNGDLLSDGTQEVAIIQRIDKETGQATIFTTRQPNTAGVKGKGALLNLVVRHLNGASATLRVTDAGLRDSRQKQFPVNIEQGSLTIE